MHTADIAQTNIILCHSISLDVPLGKPSLLLCHPRTVVTCGGFTRSTKASAAKFATIPTLTSQSVCLILVVFALICLSPLTCLDPALLISLLAQMDVDTVPVKKARKISTGLHGIKARPEKKVSNAASQKLSSR